MPPPRWQLAPSGCPRCSVIWVIRRPWAGQGRRAPRCPWRLSPLLTAPWPPSGLLFRGPACPHPHCCGRGSAPRPRCGRLPLPAPRARPGAGGVSTGCRCPQGEGLQRLGLEDGRETRTSVFAPESVPLLSLSRARLFGPHALQPARPPCPSLSPGVCPSSRPWIW